MPTLHGKFMLISHKLMGLSYCLSATLERAGRLGQSGFTGGPQPLLGHQTSHRPSSSSLALRYIQRSPLMG